MGKRGIDVNSSKSAFKSAFNKNYSIFLYVLLFSIFISGLLLSGCASDEVIDGFKDCSTADETYILDDDESYLCVKPYSSAESSNDFEGEVCFRDLEGLEITNGFVTVQTTTKVSNDYIYDFETNKIINQMFAEIFYDVWDKGEDALSGMSDTWEWHDSLESGAICADHFFGDDIYCEEDDCEDGDGFGGDIHDDGGADYESQAHAIYPCTDIYSIKLNELDSTKQYGFDPKDLSKLTETLGADSLPLMLKCFDSVTDSGGHNGNGEKFDLYDDDEDSVTNELIVTQEVNVGENEDGSPIIKLKAFYCDGNEWIKIDSDLSMNSDLDSDYDDAPDFSEDWDCDSDSRFTYTDLGIFDGFEEDDLSVEICGDGKSNKCPDSELYTNLADYYINLGYDVGQLTTDEIDTCDENPYACEHNCLESERECDYIDYSETDEGAETDDIETDEGYCCGADQIDDLGVIIESDSGSNKACLKVGDDKVVGSKSGESSSDSEDVTSCDKNSDWCWVDPQTNIFEILTLKINGEKSWDIVSNSENWFTCNDDNILGTLEKPETTISGDNIDDYRYTANRFICYDQGDRNVWVECADPEAIEGLSPPNQDTVKFRNPGDGFFNLMSGGTNINLEGDYGGGSNYYDQYRELDYSVDFTNYDYLDFFVEFTNPEDLVYPADVHLKINGFGQDSYSEDVVYFDENVLGYAITSPDLSGSDPIHVKVPVGDWLDVSILDFTADGSEGNEFTVKNLHLTKTENDINYYCSGYSTKDTEHGYNSWIEDFDQSDEHNPVIGEKICQNHFGANAWLGSYGELEIDDETASCCGDDENEYYAGKSADDSGLGCWNSKVIENDQTVMNVEYKVEYEVQDFTMDYPDQEFEYGVALVFSWLDLTDYNYNSYDLTSISQVNNPSLTSSLGIGGIYSVPITSGPVNINYNESPKVIATYYGLLDDIYTWNSASSYSDIEIVLNWTENETVSLYLFDAKEQNYLGDDVTITIDDSELLQKFTIQLIAETNILESTAYETTTDSTFNYPCLQDECVYALPGNPPYKVTNLHPGLYELYYRFGDNDEDEILITSIAQEYTEDANLVVKKLSQQVLHYNQSFWGCNAADYITNTNIFTDYEGEDLSYCDIQGSYYCAYQDNNYLVSTWSNNGINETGYEEIAEYEEDMEFELASCNSADDCAATDRNYSTSVVPGRNFVSNSDFSNQNGDDVVAWKLRDSNNQLSEDEDYHVNDNIFTIESGNILWSEKIALYSEMDYQFSQNSSCSVNFYLYDTNDAETVYTTSSSLSFNSGSYTYAVIEVPGECSFHGPMIQLVDDMGAQDYNYDNEFQLRKGAACCPEDMCWNGYVCVNNMAPYTYMTEQSGEVDYRCIDGQWTHMDPKYDWNFDEYGFCSNDNQCFVTSSLSEGADSGATPNDFYDGNYPTCVNSSEYILDHYCEDGEWSSRTKYLATKLLNYADSQDYVMYCTDLETNYLDYAVSGYNYINYIMGESSGEVETESSLGDSVTNTTTSSSSSDTTSICFSALENSETGRRLVDTEENTCINNVCVLKYESGNDFATAFATSMNRNTSADNSFLIPLGISSSDKEEFCASGDNSSDFQECSEELWYAPEINSLIYAKDGISIESNLVDEIFDWFGSLFSSSTLQDNEDFLDEATNFNKLYMMSMDNGNYVVRAIEEKNVNATTLIAEYDGFNVPVCDYVNNINEEYVIVEQWPAEPNYLVNCSLNDEGVYEVITATNTDFWWPNLVGRLRYAQE